MDLLRDAIGEDRSRWADFGSGDGAFTLALRDLLGPTAEIFSIEKDRTRLDVQRHNFRTLFPQSNIHFVNADFTKPFDLAALDGIVMANALHYYRDKLAVLNTVRQHLKPSGRFVLIEYNVDAGNLWVPHPISFVTFRALAARAGFRDPIRSGAKPSHFLKEIYSAVTTMAER
jgi:ubiquinone/menaquinone biosynthesis C-methylase UbiE